MNLLTNNNFYTTPNTVYFQPSGTSSIPSSVEMSDRWLNTGSGIGEGSTASTTALGEYYERRHFASEVVTNSLSKLGEMHTDEETSTLTNALFQTMQGAGSKSTIINHLFNTTTVIRTIDFTSTRIPTILLTLNTHQNTKDNFFYPHRDTCGCSFHWKAELSILGSIKEMLERQFLLKFWLTEMYSKKLSASQIAKSMHGTSTHPLILLLAKSGQITAFDISEPGFPGKCVLLIYGNPDPDRSVNYCAGMSYSNNLSSALQKATLELWQTFRFLNLYKTAFDDISKVRDPYLRHFIKSNIYHTYKSLDSIVSLDDTKSQETNEELTLKNILHALDINGCHGYLYVKKIKTNTLSGTYSKFLSPNLFLHMDNSSHLNIKNIFSDKFAGKIIKSHLENMVPFP